MIDKNTAIGTEFAGKPKKMSWERIWTFSGGPFTFGWPKKTIHTSIEFAASTGLKAVNISGLQYQGHLNELMFDIFGDAWFSNGNTSKLKFIKSAKNDDVVQTKAILRSKEIKETMVQYDLEVWCENQMGEKLVIGTVACTMGEN